MVQLVEELLSSKSIHPAESELAALSARWRSLQRQRGNLEGIPLDGADMALRHIPGGDHLEQ